MRKRAQKSNKQFLIGTAAMAFGVGVIVTIFLLLCSQHSKSQATSYKELYQIEFKESFIGDSAIIYLNDSLVWNDIIPSDTFRLRLHRFADENTLMVSRSHEDAVSIFPINKKSGRLILSKDSNGTTMTLVKW